MAEFLLVGIMEKRMLKPVGELLHSLFFFNLLYSGGVGIDQALKHSQVYQVMEKLPSRLQGNTKSFFQILEQRKSIGGNLSEKLQDLLEDTQFIRDEELEKFKASCSAIQFLVLALFYFPCFFIVLLGLMEHFQMA